MEEKDSNIYIYIYIYIYNNKRKQGFANSSKAYFFAGKGLRSRLNAYLVLLNFLLMCYTLRSHLNYVFLIVAPAKLLL